MDSNTITDFNICNRYDLYISLVYLIVIAWVARPHTLIYSGGVTLGFDCISVGFLINGGFRVLGLFAWVSVYYLVKFVEFGYHLVYGISCFFVMLVLS